MKENYILIGRSKLVENTISPYDNNGYDLHGLVNGISKKGLQKAIHVRPIPDTNTFEIIDGTMRNRAYGILNRLSIECIVCEVSKEEMPDLIIELNRTREKTFLDKLEEGYLALQTMPAEPGKRNDLSGNISGKTRTDIAGEKVNVSASSLEKYVVINR